MRWVGCLSVALWLPWSSACTADNTSQIVEVASESGALTATATPDPDPPPVGESTLELAIVRTDGSALTAAQLSDLEVELWMPAHGHGSAEPPVVESMTDDTEAAGTVRIRLEHVRYIMSGGWLVRVDVDVDGVTEHFVIPQAVQ